MTLHQPEDQISTVVPATPQSTAALPKVHGYEILSELGRGGMGVVYKARDIRLNRVVALKMVLSAELASIHDLARFQSEAEAVAELSHPHIVQIYEVGESGGLPYFTLEFCPNGSLSDLVKDGPMLPDEAARMVERIAHGIAYAHARGIVHRDLKPANVLISSDGTPKVTDFGLAKKVEGGHELTHSGAMMGTPAYMSPEQAAGMSKRVGPASDIHALGAILYRLLTGVTPFTGQTPMETILGVLHETPPSLRSIREDVPRDLEVIALKCLRKAPEERYASAAALADDLRRWHDGEPIEARPVGRLERISKWVRRNPLVAGSMALVAITLTASALTSTLLGMQALAKAKAEGEARRDAQEARNEAQQRAESEAEARQATLRELRRADELLYINDCQSSRAAWERGELATAYRHLEGCRWDQRGWEHHYLAASYRTNHVRLLAASDGGAALSGDGRRILVGSSKGAASILDATTGQVQFHLAGHARPITSVAYSPDGLRVATGAWEDTVRIWDAKTGELLLELTGYRQWVSGLAFSQDGTRLLTAASNGTIRVVDVVDGTELVSFEAPPDIATSVAFSPDESHIAVGSRRVIAVGTTANSVTIWDAQTGKRTGFSGPLESAISAVAYSPDGRHIATASDDHRIRIWESDTLRTVRVLDGHTLDVTCVAYCPDGSPHIVSGSADGTIRVWDALAGTPVDILKGHSDRVESVVYAPDGGRIISGSADGSVRVWSVGGRAALTLQGWSGDLRDFTFSRDRRRIAAISADNQVRIWDALTGRPLLSVPQDNDYTTALAINSNGSLMATCNLSDSRFRIWDVSDEKPVILLDDLKSKQSVSSLAFSPNGSLLAEGDTWDGSVRLRDVRSGVHVARLSSPGSVGSVTALAFDRTGKLLTAGTSEGVVKLWQLRTRGSLAEPQADLLFTLRGHSRNVTEVRFGPAGDRLVGRFADGSLRIWDVATGQQMLAFNETPLTQIVSYTPDGQSKAVVELPLWEFDTLGQEVLRLRGHTDIVSAAWFGPTGTQVYSQDPAGRTRSWDAATGRVANPPNTRVDTAKGRPESEDGRFRVSWSGTDVLIVDIRKEAEQQARDALRLSAWAWPNPEWHAEQAEITLRSAQWFSLAFHSEQLSLCRPERDDLAAVVGHSWLKVGRSDRAGLHFVRAVLANPNMDLREPAWLSPSAKEPVERPGS